MSLRGSLFPFLSALGHYGFHLGWVLVHPPVRRRNLGRWKDQLHVLGVQSVPLVLLTGFFAGSLMAWQVAYQLEGWVSTSLVGGQSIRVICMEIGPVLTALVLAGRYAGGITAELGALQLTDQVSALHGLGLSPLGFLAVPRVWALGLMMPLLVVFAMTTGVLGSFAVMHLFQDVSLPTYFQSVRQSFQVNDVAIGLAKSCLFGFIMGSVACFKGLQPVASTAMLGRRSLQAFVASALGVLMADYLVWVLVFALP